MFRRKLQPVNSSSIGDDFCYGEMEDAGFLGLIQVDIQSSTFEILTTNITFHLLFGGSHIKQYNKYIKHSKVLNVAMQSNYRDITISYHKISLDVQVPCTQLVSHYFTQTFRKHNDYFNKQAQKHSISITTLSDIDKYDVRLNSLKPQSSIRNAQLEFGAYNPQKRLVFYILEEQIHQNSQEEQQKDQPIEFQLLTGGSIERSQSLNIKGKKMEEVEMDLRKFFGIESSQLIQFIHSGSNQIITIQRNQQPYKKFKALGLIKVGVKRVYSAG